MYERILVPLDGSRFSEEMIPYAKGLAAGEGSTLALLRLVGKPAEQADASAYVEQLAKVHGAEGLCQPASGDVADAILAEAARVPGTLVAMTSHGHSGLMEAMLGSVAMRVVRGGAGAPVLVYRPTGKGAPSDAPVKIESVVLPLDGTELSEAMAPQAAELARRLDAELMLVVVIDPKVAKAGDMPVSAMMKGLESGYVRSNARDFASRYGVRVNWEVLYGEPADAITSFVAGRPGTLLAMVTRGRPALESALLGSVTSGCLRKAAVPVLMRTP